MQDKKCTKHFPKRFNQETYVDGDGYPCYKGTDNGKTIVNNDIVLDNRDVVPHNPQ